MKFFENKNRILSHLTLTVFVLFMFFAPVSVSFVEIAGDPGIASTISLEENIVYAANPPSDTGVGTTLWNWTVGALLNGIGLALIGIGSFFVGLAGNLLDYSLQQFVFGMGDKLGIEDLGVTVDGLWKFVRDLCNLTFIFGFIYVGFMTILDSHNADTKKMLARIIIGALLINFSLFFAKAIIDLSNFTAFKIYEAMAPTHSISTTITQQLGLVTLFDAKTPDGLKVLFEGSHFWFFVFGFILLMTTAFTFFASAFLLVSRFCVLILLMIGAPLLFAATIFPQTKSYAEDMWKTLIGYSFYAPVYLLLILISIQLISKVLPDVAGAAFSDALKGAGANNEGFISLLLAFGVSIFFMISSLTLAQKMSIAGGTTAIKIGNDLRGRGQRMLGAGTAGLAAAAGRATAGRYAHKVSEDKGLKDRAATSFFARQKLNLARKTADVSFDARNIGGAGKSLGVGEGRKGGYKTVLKDMKQKEEEYAKSLGEVDEDDIHVATRKEEMHEEERKLRALEIDLREAQGDEAKKKIREKIEEQKHHIHEAKVKYETEKQRRILGSTFTKYRSKEDETKLTALETEAHVQEDKIKAQWKAYHAEKDETQKTTLRTEIEKMRAALKKNKDEHKALLTLQPERGYASVFENSTRLTAWTEGRLVAQNKEVGKEMRKIRADGLPKEKAGHDAHGGGGAHGGGHSGGNTHDKKEGHDGGEEDAHSEGQGKIVLDTNIKAAKQASAHPPKGGGGDHGHGGGGHQ